MEIRFEFNVIALNVQLIELVWYTVPFVGENTVAEGRNLPGLGPKLASAISTNCTPTSEIRSPAIPIAAMNVLSLIALM